jgi:precorrin-8X/cobalt-precorrin-8 methylmutase
LVEDDVGTRPNGKPTNKCNRFEVAGRLNALIGSPGGYGPFWSAHPPGSIATIPQRQPPNPFVSNQQRPIPRFRQIDELIESDFPFRLYGNGSVGSQTIMGLPRLTTLRFHPQLNPYSAVWPFETGWAEQGQQWLNPTQRIIYAEIYPSVRPPIADTITDRGQVTAMWQWANELDRLDQLQARFQRPNGVIPGSPDDVKIRTEEGWVLH